MNNTIRLPTPTLALPVSWLPTLTIMVPRKDAPLPQISNRPKYSPDFVYGDSSVPARRKGVAEKCTLCKERTDRGEEPMCVACCPAKARIYGDLDDPESEISQVIAKRHGYVLLEEQGTKPQVHYFK